MAQKQWDYVRGQSFENVTKGAGSAIATSAVRVTVDDGNATTKEEALKGLRLIAAKITVDTWPAA